MTVCCGLRSRHASLFSLFVPLSSFAMCRFLLSCSPIQQAASGSSSVRRNRLRLLLLHRTLPLPPPPSSLPLSLSRALPCALLCYFKRSDASWVLQCLSRACLVTYGGGGSSRKTTIPRVPRGPHQSIRLQHIRGDGVGGDGVGRGEDLQRPVWCFIRD